MSGVVVITGLAQGMGREVAKLLAGEGYAIAGFDEDRSGPIGWRQLAAMIAGFVIAMPDLAVYGADV